MSTIDSNDFDYPAYTKKASPDPAKIQRGADSRHGRFEATMTKQSVRIDDDLVGIRLRRS